MANGAWIFVSHSNHDIEKVRRVRNALEDRGHFPLLFFLRSVTDDSELDTLLKREIQARTFFLLCDSPNASASRWVQQEVEFIQAQPDKISKQLYLDDPWETQMSVVDAISIKATAYLSYAADDRIEAEGLGAALREADYAVLGLTHSLSAGTDWQAQTERDIDDAIRNGVFLCFLTPERLNQKRSVHWFEVHYALQTMLRFPANYAPVVPVILQDYDATVQMLPPELAGIHCLNLANLPTAERAKALLHHLAGRPR